jgi:hypothetical protein
MYSEPVVGAIVSIVAIMESMAERDARVSPGGVIASSSRIALTESQ